VAIHLPLQFCYSLVYLFFLDKGNFCFKVNYVLASREHTVHAKFLPFASLFFRARLMQTIDSRFSRLSMYGLDFVQVHRKVLKCFNLDVLHHKHKDRSGLET
jgi:hypothetical protein